MNERSTDLVVAARELFEEKGLAYTSVKDITERAGVSRALFYHYFSDKEAIVSAVLDDFVADFTESVRLWNEGRTQGDVEGALRDCIKMVRRILFDSNYFRKVIVSRENAGLYLEFLNRAAESLSAYIVATTVKDYENFHQVEIEYVPETFYVLITGLVGYMRNNPDAGDEVLMAIAAQTLRLDIESKHNACS